MSRRHAAASRWLHAALALALVLAQALGLLHRTAHAPHAADRAATASHVALHAGEAHAGSGLFGHAAGQGDACRLFDQLALADLLVDATIALPVFDASTRAMEATGTAEAPAATTAYRARAPPSIG